MRTIGSRIALIRITGREDRSEYAYLDAGYNEENIKPNKSIPSSAEIRGRGGLRMLSKVIYFHKVDVRLISSPTAFLSRTVQGS